MTKADLAELRGEIFGLKIALMNIMAHVMASVSDPIATLDSLRDEAVRGIAAASPTNIPIAYLRTFQNAAAGVILQATEAAKVPHEPVPPREQRQ